MSEIIKTEEVTEEAPAQAVGPTTSNNPFFKVKAYLGRGGTALQYRNFRLFWTGQLISLIGTWMQNLAQAWLVLTLSHSDPFALGLVSALQFLPSLLLSLFTGVIADRYPKRTLLLITQSSAAALAAILGILTTTGAVQIWHVYLLAFLLGIVNAFDMPTRQAFVSEMVDKKELMNAVALNSTIFNAGRVVGPAIAGLLIGLGETIFRSTEAGIAFAIWLNAASYLAVIVNLARMRVAELFRSDGKLQTEKSILKNLREGLSFIGHNRPILTLIIIVGMMGTFGFNFNVWIPLLAQKYLGVGADGYGILMAGLGAGALLSAIMMALGGRTPNQRRIMIALFWFSVFEAVVAVSSWYWLSLLAMAGTGFWMIRVGAASNTFIQMNSPARLRGRVMSIYLLVFAGTTPIGSLFVGWLGNLYGTPFSMLAGAALSLTALPMVWALTWWRQHHIKTEPVTV